MIAEAGLFYFFEWQGGVALVGALAEVVRETIVFGDGARAYLPMDSGSFAAGDVRLALRQRPDERFIDAVKRLGVEPFRERVYATR